MIKDLYRMAVFARVVEKGSFTAAARELGLGKSVVSQHVSALEETVGVQLLNRSTRALRLTTEGERFYVACRRMLLAAEDGFDELEAARRRPRGVVRVTAPYNLGVGFLMPAIREFRAIEPEIVVEACLEDRVVNVIDEGFDIALRVGGEADSGLYARRLGRCRGVLCGSPGYFERRTAPAGPEDLASHDWIALTPLQPANRMVFTRAEEPSVTVRLYPVARTNTGLAAREMMLAGVGIGPIPDYAVRADIAAGRLRTACEDWSFFETSIAALYPHKERMSRRTRLFLDYLAHAYDAFAGDLSPVQSAAP